MLSMLVHVCGGVAAKVDMNLEEGRGCGHLLISSQHFSYVQADTERYC
jgi:hypothetical protein